ncbi:hypothetical protein BRC81_03420 [Halobacteriales archaeon QS_1_68_20]|nr:MAG: hypothetical protein BRC81_03420 [Halobacteriales archaeon QS_1_68_20]
MSDSPGNREVAHRVFAAEYDDANLQYSESDEERAPNYVLTPTGPRVNRLFLVGVLTEVEAVSDDVLRARIVDPTGAFVVYAGQYQPEAATFFEATEPPAFVAVTGKARTFSPDDADRVYTSVRPESVNAVDAETRDRWVVNAAEQTLARAATFAAALDLDVSGDDLRSTLEAAGAAPSLAAGIPVALDHYGTTEHYLAGTVDLARDALRLVAGEIDEVDVPSVAPGDPGDGVVDYRHVAESVQGAVVDVDPPAAAGAAGDEASSGEAAASGSDDAETPSDPETAASDDTAVATASAESGGTESAETSEAGPDETTEQASDEASETTSDDTTASADSDDVGDFDDGEVGDFDDDDVGDFDSDGVGDFEPGGGLDDASSGDDSTGGESADDDAAVDEGEVPDEVLDEDERERIEQEFGTDFSTGTEVGDPGEAGIEPEAGPIEPSEDEAAAGSDSAAEAEPSAADAEAPTDGESATETEPATDETEETDSDESAGGESAGEDPADPVADEDEAEDATPDQGETDEPAAEEPAEDEPADVDLDEALMDEMAALDDGDGADREALTARLVDEYGADPGEVEDAIEDALMGGKCYEPADGKLKPI